MMQPRNSSKNSFISFSSLSSLRRRERLNDKSLAAVFYVMTSDILLTSVGDPALDPDQDPLFRGMDPDPDPSLFS
jgi:hypothetical protein